MMKVGLAGAAVAAIVTAVLFGASSQTAGGNPSVAAVAESAWDDASTRRLLVPRRERDAGEDSVYDAAARSAWGFIETNYQVRTGLVNAQPDWAFPTLWDIGSTLGAYYAAHQLGFLNASDYEQRVRTLLTTLRSARLYDGVAYGRNYSARTGELVDARGEPASAPTGYSALDLGRLLVWLRIVAEDLPQLRDDAAAAAARIDARRVIRDGYMWGEEPDEPGQPPKRFQEGRIGYEQYAARGFALWNMTPRHALRLDRHARRADVLGVRIMADDRGMDRLTSEPFLMMGMELGFDEGMGRLARAVLAAQAARHERTGQITMATEDALAVEPHYFYYYCVYCNGSAFNINVHTRNLDLDEPRWVSTKAAFAWHALLPTEYTWQAVAHVQPARHRDRGWASGVFERTGTSTETYALNTAALILEAAAYRKRGAPFLAVSAAQ